MTKKKDANKKVGAKKMGRPLIDDVPRSALIQMRVTPAQRDAIHKKASLAGMSLTAFMVGLALGDRLGGMLSGEGFSPSEVSAVVPVNPDGSIDVKKIAEVAEAAVEAREESATFQPI